MVIEIVLFVVGLVLLYFGAEFLVAGASAVALRFGITPLVVGLTVVAFGTSSPELLVCLIAAFQETGDISVGNILGSNIANILLILGCSSLIRPMEVHSQIVRREYAVMAVASIMLVLVALDGQITRIEGGLLALSMVFYLVYTFISERKKGGEGDEDGAGAPGLDEIEDIDPEGSAMWADWLRIAGGIGGLAGGAYLMVDSATTIATAMGISQLVIGITIVAFGTSLPELATSLVAAFREESDISVGNVIGSNIFNVFLVLGLATLVLPIMDMDANVQIDLWIMLGVAIGIWPILRTGHRISRAEGGLMLLCYAAYIVYLFLRPA